MSKKNIDFLPVILGSDENAYGCARLFNDEYGIVPSVLCAKPLAATAYSRILDRNVITDLDRFSVFVSAMPEILSELKKKHGRLLLIPCSDYYASLTIKSAPRIAEFIENPIISEETYRLFSDKAAFHALALRYGIPHPETVISKPSAFSAAMLPFEFPVILKPHNSNSSEYLRADIPEKKKAYLCEDRDHLDSVLMSFVSSGYDRPVVIQRFIPGGCDSMRVINAYCDQNGKVRLIGAAQVLIEYTDGASAGNYMALRPVHDRQLCDEAADILERLGYRGFANFDLKKDPESGKFLYFELNPRQGRSSYYIHTAGKNLMRAMVEDVIYGSPFNGREYAELDGIWGALPKPFLSRTLDPDLLRSTNFDFALRSHRDFSPARSLVLARRNYTVALKNR